MDITTYFKNIYNYVSTKKEYLEGDKSVSWYKYISEDYGSARGIDFNIQKMLSNFISGSASYCLAWTSGNSAGVVLQDDATSLREFPLPWDIRHNFGFNITFKVQKGEEFYLPFTDILVPTFITDDFSTNFTFGLASGSPYTPLNDDDSAMDMNSELKPSTYSANLKFQKKIRLASKSSFRVYCNIGNLFNKKNVNWVYGKTGSATNDGKYTYVGTDEDGNYVETKPAGHVYGPNDYVSSKTVEIYNSVIKNPTAISQGRTLEIGVSFNF